MVLKNNKILFGAGVDKDVYDKFRAICDKEGYLIGRRIQVLMQKDIEERQKKVK